jgi:hypothetical protein
MNSTEERLRAAARTAMGMFPPDGDLPPLRLPEASRSRGRLHDRAARREGASGILRFRTWLAPLAAAAAVTAVITAIVVPSQMASRTGNAKPARATVPSAPSLAEQRQQLALDALIIKAVAPATGLQYDQGGKLIWMLHGQYLRGTARCMAALGYHVSDRQPPYNLADFADNTQMPDLPRIARTHEFVGRGDTPFGALYSAAEQRALDQHCRAVVAPYQPLLNAYQAINSPWWQIISRAQASRPVEAAIPALSACAARYGYPNDPYGNATGPIKSPADFMDWVSGFLDGASSRGASQSTMNALERHWTSVFVSCATPIVGIYQRMLVKAQPGFLHQHAQQIARLDELAWKYLGRPGR